MNVQNERQGGFVTRVEEHTVCVSHRCNHSKQNNTSTTGIRAQVGQMKVRNTHKNPLIRRTTDHIYDDTGDKCSREAAAALMCSSPNEFIKAAN